jgi:hypothetical protein
VTDQPLALSPCAATTVPSTIGTSLFGKSEGRAPGVGLSEDPSDGEGDADGEDDSDEEEEEGVCGVT